MLQRVLRLFAVAAVGAAMLTGAAAAASADGQSVRVTTLDGSRFLTAHGYYADVFLGGEVFNSAPAQQWEFEPTGAPDTYVVVNVGDGNCMLGTGTFGSVLRGTCGDTTTQWQLIDHANGSISFKNIASGTCLDRRDPPYDMWLQTNTCDASVTTQQFVLL